MDVVSLRLRGRSPCRSFGALALGIVLTLCVGGSGQAAASKFDNGFLSPDREIWCIHSEFASICGGPARIRPSSLALGGSVNAHGRASLCYQRGTACIPNFDTHSPVLRLGEQVSGDGTTCKSKRRGIVCTADRNGHGFRINAHDVERVGSASSACTPSAAKKLINKYDMNAFLLDDPVNQLLCGSFAGTGSRVMVVTVSAAICWSPQRWAIFKWKGSRWKLVLDRHEWVYPLEVVNGTELRVTSPVHGAADARCEFTGGTRSRVWHWQGGKFVHGAWGA